MCIFLTGHISESLCECVSHSYIYLPMLYKFLSQGSKFYLSHVLTKFHCVYDGTLMYIHCVFRCYLLYTYSYTHTHTQPSQRRRRHLTLVASVWQAGSQSGTRTYLPHSHTTNFLSIVRTGMFVWLNLTNIFFLYTIV